MREYEMVREIPNLCRNNQMRDVFFDEVALEIFCQFIYECVCFLPIDF